MKNTYSYFMTVSSSPMGMEMRKFVDEKHARKNALDDPYNSDFTLYKVIVTVEDGEISENKEYVCSPLACHKSLINKKWTEDRIADCDKEIEKNNSNTKILERTRTNRNEKLFALRKGYEKSLASYNFE